MKIRITFLTLFLLLPLLAESREFEIPHNFNPGDTLSSVVLNEIFDNIKSSKSSVTAEELIGEWSCVGVNGYATQNGAASGWQDGTDDLYSFLNNVSLELQDDGDGTYSLISNSPNPFLYDENSSIETPFTVLNNNIYFNFSPDTWPNIIATYSVTKISNTKIIFTSFTENFGGETQNLICDLQNLPPENPKQLSATLSGSTVSLTWSDESDDETGFKILRRDSLTGEFAEIGTSTSASYTDTLTSDGKYWYRVVAVNENGDSLGSNVVKVTLGDDSESLIRELRMLKDRMEVIEGELGGSP